MPDVMITLLVGCALGFGIGYAVRERGVSSAPPPPSRAKHLLEGPIYCPNCGRCIRIFDFYPPLMVPSEAPTNKSLAATHKTKTQTVM